MLRNAEPSFVATEEGLMTAMKHVCKRGPLTLETHSFHTLGPWRIVKGLINTEHSIHEGIYATIPKSQSLLTSITSTMATKLKSTVMNSVIFLFTCEYQLLLLI